MIKKNVLAFMLCFFCVNTLISQENFRLMFYNLLNFPLQGSSNRIQNLDVILNDYQPDLFMVCELNNVAGANSILTSIQTINPNYLSANFVTNTSDDSGSDQNDLQNLLYYDSSKFILEFQTEITTTVRDFNHYQLKLNTVNQATSPILVDVFVVHLKSSNGTSNQNIRLAMVNALQDYLDTLPSNSYVILAGDLNLYTSSEPAFQELINPTNSITFTDPANRVGSWSNNTTYLDVFTQSTRTQTGLGGATGGFDDRFDFILTSENILTNSDLYYVNNSYAAYGNNNNINCYNDEINSANCSGTDYNFNIRNALYNMSDHLPVTLELQTNEALLGNSNVVLNQKALKFNNGNLIYSLLKLEINTLLFRSKTIAIYNVLGKKMAEESSKEKRFLEFDVSRYSSGMYYIVPSNKNDEPLKFIKY